MNEWPLLEFVVFAVIFGVIFEPKIVMLVVAIMMPNSYSYQSFCIASLLRGLCTLVESRTPLRNVNDALLA